MFRRYGVLCIIPVSILVYVERAERHWFIEQGMINYCISAFLPVSTARLNLGIAGPAIEASVECHGNDLIRDA
jgi:hypothetical protein